MIKLSQQSLGDEAEKFEEALVAVMSQRIQEYMMVKLGEVDDDKLKKTMQLAEFKEILKDALDEFKTFYSVEIMNKAPIQAKKAGENFIKKI